jgi:hypothetical protein
MEDLRQLLHEELDKIFDELSKRVDIKNTILNLEIVADEDSSNETYNNVVVTSELQPDSNDNWNVEAHDWVKTVISLDIGNDLSREGGEW